MTMNLKTLIAHLENLIQDSYWVIDHLSRLCWAVQNLGLLGFLHGKSGEVHNHSAPPAWLIHTWRSFVTTKGLDPATRPEVNWGQGMISWLENGRPRQMKLGKWLRKAGATDSQIKEFETREMEDWEWKISCSLWDILTMSHNRGWTSCMRPGGSYEFGPLTDMRVGAALLFWYRPGASQPCGREVLRPAVIDGKPAIIRGGRTYGSGGKLSNEELTQICEGVDVLQCALDKVEAVLTDKVYDDNCRCGHHQSPDEMQEAEERLLYVWRGFLARGAGVYETFDLPEEEATPKSPVLDWRDAWTPHGGLRNSPIRHIGGGMGEYFVFQQPWTAGASS